MNESEVRIINNYKISLQNIATDMKDALDEKN